MISLLLQCCPGTAQIVKYGCDINAATSCNDVKIVAIICGAIVLVALFASICFWRWTGKKYSANSEDEQKNSSNNDREEKQKWELTGKLLDFLEKRSYDEEFNEGKITKKYKSLSDEECKYYLEILINLIGKKDVPVFGILKEEKKDGK